jgi:hypothetical protein
MADIVMRYALDVAQSHGGTGWVRSRA